MTADSHAETLATLTAARELLSDPKRWTKGAVARNSEGGYLLFVDDPDACCWCASGAVAWVLNIEERLRCGEGFSLNKRCLTALCEELPGGGPVWEFNDDPNTTHADVLALYDRTIERVKQQIENQERQG